MAKSLYDIVADLDNFPYSDTELTPYADHLLDKYHALRVEGIDADLGYIPTTLVRRIAWPDKDWVVVDGPRALVLMTPAQTPASCSIRTQMMEAVVHRMIEAGCTDIHDGWRDERFSVYGPDGDVVFEIERSASAYFGVVTSGVQMLGYVEEGHDENARMRLWIAKRSMRKQTYPGMMDCTAAGALSVGQTPRSTVVLEAAEEASIPSAVLEKGLRRCGCISYFHAKGLEDDSMVLLLPEVEYLYELELDPGTVPRPKDGEVEDFRLWDVDQVLDALRRGWFKPNSAVAVIDFLIRHGMISRETEPRNDNPHPPPARNILDAIGNTPVIRLNHVVPASSAAIYIKLEFLNPTGSYKDRMARSIIEEAERRGTLRPGMTVVEATGGSTGSSLAFICAAKKFPFRVVSSDAFAVEKLRTMEALGATLDLVPSPAGITPDLIPSMVRRAKELARGEEYYLADQFNNKDASIGYEGIGHELVAQFPDGIDAFCGAVGGAGMVMGVSRVLKAKWPSTHVAVLEPASSPTITEGRPGKHSVEGIGIGFVPPHLERELYDEACAVEEEEARAMCRRLAREEGLLVGTSTGLNVVAAIALAKRLGPGKTVVTVAVDTGLKYMSGNLFTE